MTCAWCSRPLSKQKGGIYLKRFCSAACRTAMHTAARRYTLALIDGGFLSIEQLKASDTCQKNKPPSTKRRPPKADRPAQLETADGAPASTPATP